MAADVVLTTKSLAAQRSGMDLNNCTGQYLCAKTQNTDDLSRHHHGHGTEHQAVVTDGQA